MADYEIAEFLESYATALGPEADGVIAEMGEQARDEGFPYVGPAVGGWLAMLARFADAERVFEFGSGFGYSAYWFARELPADGQVVLTEIDADELDQAREYLARGDLADRAAFEHGDAIETVDDYEGPFDVVLIDCQKERYAEAFEAVREKVAPGGIVAADNTVAGGSIDAGDLRAYFEDGGAAGGADRSGMNGMTEGIADYLDAVGAADGFETTLLPLGEGVSVSQREW
ncbi:O-methyltransferase family protein [Halosimplex carlsbadense 2-9-1]|uniref:O-methyltransferase family protein n=1 Tax=Halosimplex carlsbadense 2-9-1 TaxID=797114 RepID=M0CBB6_9EURY|nr:O-methyltransferase [Halosimplex carlsbadense]ELZ20566.1 O-methyltransferase family protein [Halosimplex carlsbadense 2-9-1]